MWAFGFSSTLKALICLVVSLFELSIALMYFLIGDAASSIHLGFVFSMTAFSRNNLLVLPNTYAKSDPFKKDDFILIVVELYKLLNVVLTDSKLSSLSITFGLFLLWLS